MADVFPNQKFISIKHFWWLKPTKYLFKWGNNTKYQQGHMVSLCYREFFLQLTLFWVVANIKYKNTGLNVFKYVYIWTTLLSDHENIQNKYLLILIYSKYTSFYSLQSRIKWSVVLAVNSDSCESVKGCTSLLATHLLLLFIFISHLRYLLLVTTIPKRYKLFMWDRGGQSCPK